MPNQIIKQALFVDAKAEKSNTTATLQISQTSLIVRQIRSGGFVEIPGKIEPIYSHNDQNFLSTTLLLHYCYQDDNERHILKDITACCVPNGRLQDRYNPTADISFWSAGRNALSRGEDFRVRVNFQRLCEMAAWRVQKIIVDVASKTLMHNWTD